MAAMVLQLQHSLRFYAIRPLAIAHFSSSSSSPNPPPNPTDSSNGDNNASSNKGSFSSSSSSSLSSRTSYLDEIKARLRQSSPPPRPPPQHPPPSHPFRSDSPSKTPSLEEIRKNLSEFRRVYNAQDPKPKPFSNPPSFREIYESNVPQNNDLAKTPSLEAIRESLRRMPKIEPPLKARMQTPGTKTVSPSMIKSLQDTIRQRKDSSESHLSSIFNRELEHDVKRSTTSSTQQTEFLRMYSHKELGEKLRSLRPDGVRGENWFSLEELDERLKKLREIEEKENESRAKGFSFSDLRESLFKLQESEASKKRATAPNLFLSSLTGALPHTHVSLPPNDYLLEKFSHPDNMSSAEKLKLELKRVRDEFKMSESDCGSTRVQIAQLTTKIKHLSSLLHKKDKHSRKGLEGMVQRRKKLLKYLRRTDWDSYCFVLSKLGLRDNPDYKC